MRKVIFVASTSYSGSTFLDMTLGNEPKGFSIGEVNALFEPVKRHHYYPDCGCLEKSCNLWQQVSAKPVSELYKTLFRKNPEIEFIVDSSKSPLWIHKRVKDLQKQGIDYKIALIWKTPLEIAQSFNKRGNYDNWERSWVNYHRMLYSLQPDNWVTLNYRDYASDPRSLEGFCNSLGIPYFKGKERFWEKTHHILFGNHSARRHLTHAHIENRTTAANNSFQKISYTAVNDPVLEMRVKQAIEANPMISSIQAVLESLSYGKSEATAGLDSISMSAADTMLRKVKLNMQLVKSRFLAQAIDNATMIKDASRFIPQDNVH